MESPELTTYTYHCRNRKCKQFKKDIKSPEGPLSLAVTTGTFPLVCAECKSPLTLVKTNLPKRTSRSKPSAKDIRDAIGDADAEVDQFLQNLGDQAARNKPAGKDPA
jgi:hypothetical protein